MTSVCANSVQRLVIVGAGGHGRVVADIAERSGRYGEICFLDDAAVSSLCDTLSWPLLGGSDLAPNFPDAEFFVAVGDSGVRRDMVESLCGSGLKLATLVHPSAVVSNHAFIGQGSVVMPGAVLAPGARVGLGCIVNSCSSLDHDSSLGDWSHIAVGAHVAGSVEIGSDVWIGAGATVINNIQICPGSFIGAGAVVVESIASPGVYVGVPARLRPVPEKRS